MIACSAVTTLTEAMGASLLRQSWSASAVLTNMMGHGMILSYTTCLLPALQDPHSSITADIHTASMLASSCGLAGIPGFLLSAYLMDIYGRKLPHLFMTLPAVVGWLTIFFGKNILVLLIGRILGGFSIGATSLLGATIIGEYFDPKYRGVLLNLKILAFGSGTMLVHILSHVSTWRRVALYASCSHLISIFITLTLPESPPWLASKGKFDESKKSFFWLRDDDEASNSELNDLIKEQIKKQRKLKYKRNISEVLTILTKKDFWKPILIVIISFVLLESSGRHFFPAYAIQILSKLSDSSSESFYFSLCFDIIITITVVCSTFLVKVMNRRTLLFFAGFSALAVLMIASICMTLSTYKIISNDQTWVTLGFLVIYFVLANLGCTPIPVILPGEVLPLSNREVSIAVTGTITSLAVMLVLHITPYLLTNLQVHGVFFFYCVFMFVSLVILYYILPETKDKTLQEIENYLLTGKYKDDEQNVEASAHMLKQQDC